MTHIQQKNIYPKIKTDETIRENAAHGSAQYPFKYYFEDIWEFDFHCIDWHWHPEVEFVYVKSGRAFVTVGNNKYVLSQGNGIFINTQVIHRFESRKSAIIPNIVFSPVLLAAKESLIYQKYIQPVLSSEDCQIFSPDIPWQADILSALNSIFSLQEQTDSCELQTVRLLYELWQIMYEHLPVSPSGKISRANVKEQARLQIVLQYIHENYQKDISLEELSRLVSLSKSSLLKIFGDYLHMPPIDYVIRYRLKQAAYLLDATENSVSYIAQNTGFNNAGYFCRKFKEVFHVTPGQYRRSRR